MQDVVKTFETSLCFVGPNSILSDISTSVTHVSNEDLSRLLAHISVILRYPETYISVPVQYHSVLQQVFSSPLLTTGLAEDAIIVEELSADSDKPYRQGEIMLPVFASANSTRVYNIYQADAPLATYTRAVVTGALNFFNYVVRDNRVGIARIVWADPVTGNTILKDANYDEMLALQVADGYLRLIDPEYPYSRAQYNLAMCIRTVGVLKELTQHGVSSRLVTTDLTRAIIVPWLPLTAEWLAPIGRASVDVDDVNREVFSLLYVAFIFGLDRKMSFKIVLSGFRRYAHLPLFAEIFTACTIDVWGDIPSSIASERISSRGKVLSAEVLAKKYDRMNTVFVTAHAPALSDRLVAKFTGRWMSTNDGSNRYKPDVAFIPCFSPAQGAKECCIFGYERHDAIAAERGQHKIAVAQTIEALDRDFRDTKQWTYYLSGNETLKMSYDKAALYQLRESV